MAKPRRRRRQGAREARAPMGIGEVFPAPSEERAWRCRGCKGVAQFLTLCRAPNRAEARHLPTTPSASPTPASAAACSSTGRWAGHNGPSPSSGTLAIMVPAICRDHDRSSRARSSEAVPSSTLSAKLEDQRLGYVRRQRRVSRSLVAQDIHTSSWLSLWWPAPVGCAQCPSRSMSQVAHFLCIRASIEVCDTLLRLVRTAEQSATSRSLQTGAIPGRKR